MRSALMWWLSEKYVHRSSALFEQEQYYIVSNEREQEISFEKPNNSEKNVFIR